MILTDSNILLYDQGTHDEINAVCDRLISQEDSQALEFLVGHLVIMLGDENKLGVAVNKESVQMFILHAQRAFNPGGAPVLSCAFLEASFLPQVRQQVKSNPPIPPASLALASGGANIVNASCPLGEYADRYELQRLISDKWTRVKDGTQGAQVDFQETGVPTGTWQYRVIPRQGFYAGFPTAAQTIEVV